MNNNTHLGDVHELMHGNIRSYLIGFFFSLALTLVSFYLVIEHVLPSQTLVYVIAGLAVTQAIIQVIFFLHLGKETKPRLNLIIFLFMLLVVVILVFGSIWIMFNLNERVMIGM